MSDGWPCLVFGGFFAFIGLILVLAYRQEKARTEALKRTAEELGFTFSPDHQPLVMQELSALELFSRGRSRKLYNLMRGANPDTAVSVFDYKYTTGSGKNSSTHQQTVVCFDSDQLHLPTFTLQPEGMFHKLFSVFGYQDIDFGDFPNFSNRYLLRGSSEAAIRDFFDAPLVGALERLSGVTIEGHDRRLIYYRPANRPKPEEVRRLLEEAFEVFALFRD